MATVPYLRGLKNCFSSIAIDTTPQRANLYLYSIVYKFINDICSDFTVKVADNFGAGGSGHGDHTSPNPAGENAWCVWRYPYQYSEFRTVDLYVLIQWADTDAFGASPGDPGAITGTNGDGVGMQLAWMLDGSSPWQGTTDADGADTKGTPVWHPDAMVLPAPNTRAGEFNENREYCAMVSTDMVAINYNVSTSMVGNPDFWVIHSDIRSDGRYFRTQFWSCVDVITPISGNYSASCPVMMNFGGSAGNTSTTTNLPGRDASAGVNIGTIYGDNNINVSANDTRADGGTFTTAPNLNGTVNFSMDSYASIINNATCIPNGNSNNTYDIAPFHVISRGAVVGSLGDLPYIYCINASLTNYSILTGSLYDDPIIQTTFGSNIANQTNIVVPWSGSAPTSGGTRQGSPFYVG